MIALAGNADLLAKTYTWQGGARGGGGADQTNLFKAANWSPNGFSAQNSDLIFTNVNTSPSSILDVSGVPPFFVPGAMRDLVVLFGFDRCLAGLRP